MLSLRLLKTVPRQPLINFKINLKPNRQSQSLFSLFSSDAKASLSTTSFSFTQSSKTLNKTLLTHYRSLSSTKIVREEISDSNKTFPTSLSLDFKQVYEGPLAKTAKYLKVFSISSLVLTVSLAPLIFVVDAGITPLVRTILFGAALSTSGISTALIHWCIHPYVTRAWVDTKTLDQDLQISKDTKFALENLTLFGRFEISHVKASQLGTSKRLFTSHKLVGNEAVKAQPLYYIHPEVAETNPIMNQLLSLTSGKLEALRFSNSKLQ